MYDWKSSLCFMTTGVVRNEIFLIIFCQRSVIYPLKKRVPSAGPYVAISNRA